MTYDKSMWLRYKTAYSIYRLSQWNCHNETVVNKLSQWNCCSECVTTKLLLPNCHNETVTMKLSQWNCHNETATMERLLRICHNEIITMKLSPWNCHHETVTMKLSLWNCHNETVVTNLSQWNCHNETVMIKLPSTTSISLTSSVGFGKLSYNVLAWWKYLQEAVYRSAGPGTVEYRIRLVISYIKIKGKNEHRENLINGSVKPKYVYFRFCFWPDYINNSYLCTDLVHLSVFSICLPTS